MEIRAKPKNVAEINAKKVEGAVKTPPPNADQLKEGTTKGHLWSPPQMEAPRLAF